MGFSKLKPRPPLKRRIDLPKPDGEEEAPTKTGLPKLSPEAEALISLAPRTRPQHNPTEMSRYQVAQMASLGMTHEETACIMGLTRETLYKYYRKELDFGKALCNAKVGMRLYKVATEAEGREAVTAMMFWLRTRGGWKEAVSSLELSGPGGGAIPVDMTSLSMEERATRVLQVLNTGVGLLPRPEDAVE